MTSTLKTSFPVFNGYAPKEGPKALPIAFDLTVNATAEFELLLENTQGVIQFVQSVYVDNSANSEALTIFFPSTLQRLVIPATAQGVWPVFAIDQVRGTISTTPNSGAVGNIILLNMPMPLTQWGPVNVNIPPFSITATPYTADISDAGTDTAPAVAAEFLAANPDRKGLIITANSDNVNAVVIIGAGVPLVTLLPGQSWQSGPYVTSIALSSQSATGTDAEFSWHEFE